MGQPDGRGLRPLHPGAGGAVDRRRQLLAFGWIAGLVLLALAMWVVMMSGTSQQDGSRTAQELRPDLEATGPASAGERRAPPSNRADDLAADDPQGESAPDRQEEPEPDDVVAGGSVTFDDLCTVTLPASAAGQPGPRPWDHDECTYAPIEVGERHERWIVVRASLAATDFDAPDAERRASELAVDGGVLWSSHYPSLNPGLWVVFDGPFDGAAAARAASEEVIGRSYPRVLTIDEDDRFCIADDGCIGERSE